MSIKIIDQPDVHVTVNELHRYKHDYEKAYMFYAGPIPSLEEFIRQQKQRDSRS